MAKTPSKNYALRFISGKYQGGEMLLPHDREVVMGRSSELDMVLVEDMVSRRHAKLTVDGEDVYIQDLGSTNGTFVNGEKVKKSKLSEGDRILIGTSIIKLVDLGEVSEIDSSKAPLKQSINDVRATAPVRTMSGSIEEIPLPDLLQLFSTSKKSGVLAVRAGNNVGKIYLDNGQIVFTSINDNFETSPLKCFYRLLTWTQGMFELEAAHQGEFPTRMEQSTEALLMEGMRQLDEIKRIEGDIPSPNATLALVRPMLTPLKNLAPEELDMLQLVINHQTTEEVLNHSAHDDLHTYQSLARLISGGYIVAQ
ncbi:MAG: DUF4388 domain-containing protein [Myxococcales bacterium]|nr:MAG: DUF4388 domain-containing protein [Myxococcales bacterium]